MLVPWCSNHESLVEKMKNEIDEKIRREASDEAHKKIRHLLTKLFKTLAIHLKVQIDIFIV
jgi:hypothetical protein